MNPDLQPIGDITLRGVPGLVFLGAALGGIGTLRQVLSSLPSDFPAAVVIIPRPEGGAPATLSRLLATHSALPVVEAKEGEQLEAGRVYVAPRGQRLVIRDCRFSRRVGRKPSGLPPLVDPLFVSASSGHPGPVIAVALAGCDVDSMRTAHRVCDFLIAQDPDTATPPLHTPSVDLAGIVDLVLSPAEIGQTLIELASDRASTRWSVRRHVATDPGKSAV